MALHKQTGGLGPLQLQTTSKGRRYYTRWASFKLDWTSAVGFIACAIQREMPLPNSRREFSRAWVKGVRQWGLDAIYQWRVTEGLELYMQAIRKRAEKHIASLFPELIPRDSTVDCEDLKDG